MTRTRPVSLAVLKEHKVPCLIHQARYSMFDRWTEPDLLPVLKEEGVGMIAFSPLAQGLLTDKLFAWNSGEFPCGEIDRSFADLSSYPGGRGKGP